MYDASTQWRFKRELKDRIPAVFVYFDLELSFLLSVDMAIRYILRDLSFRKYIPNTSNMQCGLFSTILLIYPRVQTN